MQNASPKNQEVQHLFSPKPLPRPLSDPLYSLRTVVVFLIATQLLMGTCLLVLGIVQDHVELLIQAGVLLIAPAFLIFVYALALPKQTTNIFYLRSFKKDASSYRIREMLEVVLGSGYRLSGIRDPRKRVPHFLKPILLIPMMLAYAGSKFLSLEAQEDWKARLWRSLSQAKGVVLDLRDLTEFVIEEIELVLFCMSPDRILFIVQNDGEFMQLKNRLAAKGIDVAPSSCVAIWDETLPSNEEQFSARCKTFCQQLPSHAAGLTLQATPLIAAFVKSTQALRLEKINACAQYAVGIALLLALTSISGVSNWFSEWPLLSVVLAILVVLQLTLLIKHFMGVLKKMRMAHRYNPAYQVSLRADLLKGLGLGLLLIAMAGGIIFAGVSQVYMGYRHRAGQQIFEANYRTLELIKMDVFLSGDQAIVDARTLLDSLPQNMASNLKLNGANLDVVGTPGSIWVAAPQTTQEEASLGFSWGGMEIAPRCAVETLSKLQSEFEGDELMYQRCLMNVN
ncbi:hypothetical protein [Limnobacter sp.]|uniref:hypothetical protein n=1 Tax=Limnobacter sp. TaxID=2003368 RepID=UPI002FE047A1